MVPLPCSWLSHCPAGSALPSITWGAYNGILLLLLALVVLWRLGLSWLHRQRRQRLQRSRQEVIAKRQAAVAEKQTGCALAKWAANQTLITSSCIPSCLPAFVEVFWLARLKDLAWCIQKQSNAFEQSCLLLIYSHFGISELSCAAVLLVNVTAAAACRAFAGFIDGSNCYWRIQEYTAYTL